MVHHLELVSAHVVTLWCQCLLNIQHEIPLPSLFQTQLIPNSLLFVAIPMVRMCSGLKHVKFSSDIWSKCTNHYNTILCTYICP